MFAVAPAPKMPPFAVVIAAIYRRRNLACPRCGGRGLEAWALRGNRREISCINCGERWWIDAD